MIKLNKLATLHGFRECLVAIVLVATLFAPDFLLSQQAGDSNARSAGANKARSFQSQCGDNGTYRSRDGQVVRRPENCLAPPDGATARCRDGTYSFSQHRSGTCSHHGGVAQWLTHG